MPVSDAEGGDRQTKPDQLFVRHLSFSDSLGSVRQECLRAPFDLELMD